MTHGHVADNITIIGNGAYISDGECDLEVDTFKFNRATGVQDENDGVYLDKDITITASNLYNLGVWGQRHTNHTVNIKLTNCDGKAHVNLQRVYISGTAGVNNITVTDCDFLTKATALYSNADGTVVIDNCTFNGGQVPVNFNHKANGKQTVTVKNSTFTSCGDTGEWSAFAAPVRFVNSGNGSLDATIENNTFTGTVGTNGDILLGTAGYGLYSVKDRNTQKGTDDLFTIRQERQYAERDSDVFFTHIYEDKHHYLWQSSHLSIFTRFIKKQGKVQRKDFKSPCGAPVAFIQHRPQAMLIACMYGFVYYDYRTGRIADAGYDFGGYQNNVTINNATFDHEGNLYISTSEHGVLMIRKGSNRVEQLENSNSSFNLATAFVNNIIEDKDNNLWIGCYNKGLYLINQRQQAFNSWSFSAQNYIIGSSVSSIAQGENGETWCTVQNSGVFCFDASGKIIAHPQSPAGTCIIYKD